MNLSQTNNYAKEFYKQLKSTHAHLDPAQIHLICGWMGVVFLRNVGITGPMHYAISSTGEQIYSMLLTKEEFEEYAKHKQEKIDERRREAEKEKAFAEQAVKTLAASRNDNHSDAIEEASDRDTLRQPEDIKE
jgi:hypothetical protein